MNKQQSKLETKPESINEVAMGIVLNTIVDAARTKVDAGPDYEEWYTMYDAFSKTLESMPRDVQRAFAHVVWHGMMIRGEAMFKLGWELRGNPDALFSLPDPK